MDKPTENALAIIGPHKPKASTTDQPLPLDGQLIDAEAKTITIDLTAIGTRIEPPEIETIERNRGSLTTSKFEASTWPVKVSPTGPLSANLMLPPTMCS